MSHSFDWKDGVLGNWSDGADWTPVGPPANNSNITIDPADAVGSFTVDDDVTTLTVMSLDIGADARLQVGFSTAVGNTPALLMVKGGSENNGTIEIRNQGVLRLVNAYMTNHGTIQVDSRSSGSGLILANGGITDGTLDIETDSQVSIASGLFNVLNSVTLTGTGTLMVGSGAVLELRDTSIDGQTVMNNGTIQLVSDTSTFNMSIANAMLNSGTYQLEVGYPINFSNDTFAHGATLVAGDETVLQLSGSIVNKGTIDLEAKGSAPPHSVELQAAATLTGKGKIVLTDADNIIDGTSLDNVDNMISGAGSITVSQLTNEMAGVIDATGTDDWLRIDTGSTVNNYGTLESNGSGGLFITDPLFNTGKLVVNEGYISVDGAVSGGGRAMIGAGTLGFGSTADTMVRFTAAAGQLSLSDAEGFSGTVAGLANNGDGGNSIDLVDIPFATLTKKIFTENAAGTAGMLKLGKESDLADIKLMGDYANAFNPAAGNPGFVLSNDGTGGTLVQYYVSTPHV